MIARLHALSSTLWHDQSGATATEYALMDLVSQRVEARFRAELAAYLVYGFAASFLQR